VEAAASTAVLTSHMSLLPTVLCRAITSRMRLLLWLLLYTLIKLHSRPKSCTASGLLTSPVAAKAAAKGPVVVARGKVSVPSKEGLNPASEKTTGSII
jgi:hypothetical protein